MHYVLQYGQPAVLPRFVRGTEHTRLLPRANTPLATVQAPAIIELTSPGMMGEPVARKTLFPSSYHVVPQIGYQFGVLGMDVESPEHPNSAAPYRLGKVASYQDTRTMVPSLVRFWADRDYPSVNVYELYRTLPAYVVGEITQDTQSGTLAVVHGEFRVGKGEWIDDRLFLIRELTG